MEPAVKSVSSRLSTFMLAPDWTVLSCSMSAMWYLGPVVGKNLWLWWSEAESAYRPVYEQGWQTGLAEAHVFYNGRLQQVMAERQDDGNLLVTVRVITEVDVTSFATLRESLAVIERALDPEVVVPVVRGGRPLRGALRLLPSALMA